MSPKRVNQTPEKIPQQEVQQFQQQQETYQEMEGFGTPGLELKKLHPADYPREEILTESPKHWDLLNQLDKTKHQTREFLRQALQEEMEYDPECTFHPQISEMSDLLMRKYSRYDFMERNKMWSAKKQSRLEKVQNQREEQENCTFTPSIIHEVPKYKPGPVYNKSGVKDYLERKNKLDRLKQRDEAIKNRRKTKSKLSSNT